MPSKKKSFGSLPTLIVVRVMLPIQLFLISCNPDTGKDLSSDSSNHIIRAVNDKEIPLGKNTIAIVGAVIIDGNGGEPLSNGCVIVKDGKIVEVGINGEIKIPEGAELVEAKGMTLLPGFIDAHFHLDGGKGLPARFLQNGVTSVRDPGAWIEAYDGERRSDKALPRLFLTGPHLDMYPPAYPNDAIIVRDSLEAVLQVEKMANKGSTAVKVYFRLPTGIIRAVCQTAHRRGIPVTAHLEITEAMDAIEAGLDGIEHITSFGLSLQPQREAEKYRQMVLGDNSSRRQGRYEVWKKIDVNGPLADSLIRYLVRKKTFVSPTLGAFEYQYPTANGKDSPAGNSKPDSASLVRDTTKFLGFNNMKSFTGKIKKAGVPVVVGSHSDIPYAELGWAYQREMELLVESGLTPAEVIVAATMENARFFRISDRLGSIEKGKIADLVLVKGNPLDNISNCRNIGKVMLNGVWVARTAN